MTQLYINSPEALNLSKEQLVGNISSDSSIDFEFIYDSQFKSAKILRDIIDTICEKNSIPSLWKSRIILITDELNNNAIEYGSQEGERNTLRIQIQYINPQTKKLSIEVKDTGNGAHSKGAKDMEQLREEKLQKGFKEHHSIRGRGLFMIISSLVDNLYFRDSPEGGLIVGIEKTLTF